MTKLRAPNTLIHAITIGRPKVFMTALNTWFDTLPKQDHQRALNHLLRTTVSFAPPKKMFVSRPRTVEIARLLLERGANANARDDKGNTPAMLTFCAYSYGTEERTPPQRPLLRLLSLHGANFDLGNGTITARSLAKQKGMLRYLENIEQDREVKKVLSQSVITPTSMRPFL